MGKKKQAAKADLDIMSKSEIQELIPETKKIKKLKTNKLYFFETKSEDGKKRYHTWTLKSSNGKVISSSTESYSKQVYAIRNVITLFGLEIEAGIHVIVDPDMEYRVFQEMR